MAVQHAVRPVAGEPQAPAPLLAAVDLEVAYGGASRALRGVSVAVGEHEAVAVLGANGAGKTTTIRAITGLLGPHGGRLLGGTLTFAGHDLAGLAAHQIVKAGIAQVPEGRMVFSGLSVEENLQTGAASGRTADAAALRDQVYELFPVLHQRRHDHAGWMSGGEQQMIAIGRGLMASPRLLILDEASLGLAPMVIEQIFGRLAEARRELGMAVLLVEQNARLALDFVDRAYVMENGRVVLEGASAALAAAPDVQASYLGVASERDATTLATTRVRRRAPRWLS
jgi:ABC-type branched-subunit amino acid transport system ATPase component